MVSGDQLSDLYNTWGNSSLNCSFRTHSETAAAVQRPRDRLGVSEGGVDCHFDYTGAFCLTFKE